MRVVITGASGALGRALALEYAAPGVTIYLQGRDQYALNQTAQACLAQGAVTSMACLDLTNQHERVEWIQNIISTSSIDLLILNAGMNTHPDAASLLENTVDSALLMQLNLISVMDLIQRCLPSMIERSSGQIALISSLSAWRGLPQTPSYSASKAGLKAYGESLRGLLQPKDIRINVVLAGYIDSRMSRAMPGPKPWCWTPQRAARAIRDGLNKDHGRISFPWILDQGCRWLSILPDGLAVWILKRLGYG